MTFDEFMNANAPNADRGTRAIALRAWDTALKSVTKVSKSTKKAAAKRSEKRNGRPVSE